MPIVDVQIVTEAGEDLSAPTAPDLAHALGQVFGVAPGRVWVRHEAVPASRYAENDSNAGVCPVFVRVLHADWPPQERLRQEAAAVAAAVGACLGRAAELVHIEYAAPGRGRVAFGGRLLE